MPQTDTPRFEYEGDDALKIVLRAKGGKWHFPTTAPTIQPELAICSNAFPELRKVYVQQGLL